jgi:hypothetical protein
MPVFALPYVVGLRQIFSAQLVTITSQNPVSARRVYKIMKRHNKIVDPSDCADRFSARGNTTTSYPSNKCTILLRVFACDDVAISRSSCGTGH